MAPGQSRIKLTRDVYEEVMGQYGILPRILARWVIDECGDQEAAEMYLLMQWQVGYLGVDDVRDLSPENKQLFDMGWAMFLDWDHKTVMNNVYMESGYDVLSAVDRSLAEIEELETWCELMGL